MLKLGKREALLQNAVEASSRNGNVRMAAQTSGGRYRLSVGDDGPGRGATFTLVLPAAQASGRRETSGA